MRRLACAVTYCSIHSPGDIRPAEGGATAITPTIHTIDADGTHRYYDLKGQQLKSKPQKGLYIENGIKHVR